MKTVLITQEERLYLPIFLSRVLSEYRKIAALILLPGTPQGFSICTYWKRLYDVFGPKDFIIYGTLFAYYGFFYLLGQCIQLGRSYSVASAAKRNAIPVYKLKDINTKEALALLKSIEPEAIISVAAPQTFSKEVIHSAKFAINIHAALLPKYRGIMPSFWVLAKGESKTGVTVHFIDEHIDTGGIILQKVIQISCQDTLHSLQTKIANVGASALLESLKKIENGDAGGVAPQGEGSYYSFPTKEAAKELRTRGRRII